MPRRRLLVADRRRKGIEECLPCRHVRLVPIPFHDPPASLCLPRNRAHRLDLEERAAQREKAKAEHINAFLEEILNYANPYLNPSQRDGNAPTKSDILAEAAERLQDGAFAHEPGVRAELERIIGMSY